MLPGDALESICYTYFFTYTIDDFVVSQNLDRDFWRKSLFSPGQSNACVRHAIMALGAAHWRFLEAERQPAPSSLDQFALSHYNKAIAQLVHHTESAQNPPSDMSTILTCCFLFVLLESLRGDLSEAVRHLDAGMRLLSDHAFSIHTQLPNRESQELVRMFHAIGSQVALFSSDRLFPDLTHLLMPTEKRGTHAGKLQNPNEAEDVMNTFDDEITHITWDLDQEEWDDEKSDVNVQWRNLRQKIDDWKIQFDTLVEDLTGKGQYDVNLEQIVNLRIQHKLWVLLMDGECLMANADDERCADLDPTECSYLLDDLDQLWSNPARSRFTLKTDLSTAFFQLYVFCPDMTVRQRIIQTLRSRKRREIIWDSSGLADFLENDMISRALGLQEERWPDIGPSADDGALVVFRSRGSSSARNGD